MSPEIEAIMRSKEEMKRALVDALREPPRKQTSKSWVYVCIVFLLLLIITGILVIIYMI